MTKGLSSNGRLIALICLLLIVPGALADTFNTVETSNVAIQILSFLLGVCGSVYLGAILWERGNRGSESWKTLSISMFLFGFWNIVMIMNVLMMALNVQDADDPYKSFDLAIFVFKTLDPLVEVVVFMVMLFGLMSIIRTMRTRPWELFNKVEENDD